MVPNNLISLVQRSFASVLLGITLASSAIGGCRIDMPPTKPSKQDSYDAGEVRKPYGGPEDSSTVDVSGSIPDVYDAGIGEGLDGITKMDQQKESDAFTYCDLAKRTVEKGNGEDVVWLEAQCPSFWFGVEAHNNCDYPNFSCLVLEQIICDGIDECPCGLDEEADLCSIYSSWSREGYSDEGSTCQVFKVGSFAEYKCHTNFLLIAPVQEICPYDILMCKVRKEFLCDGLAQNLCGLDEEELMCYADTHDEWDGDGLSFVKDNCPFVYNPGQEDINLNDIGDACECAENNQCPDELVCRGGLYCAP